MGAQAEVVSQLIDEAIKLLEESDELVNEMYRIVIMDSSRLRDELHRLVEYVADREERYGVLVDEPNYRVAKGWLVPPAIIKYVVHGKKRLGIFFRYSVSHLGNWGVRVELHGIVPRVLKVNIPPSSPYDVLNVLLNAEVFLKLIRKVRKEVGRYVKTVEAAHKFMEIATDLAAMMR